MMIKVNTEKLLLGVPASKLSKDLGLPFEFISEALIEIDIDEVKTYGEFITYLVQEHKRELFKNRKNGGVLGV